MKIIHTLLICATATAAICSPPPPASLMAAKAYVGVWVAKMSPQMRTESGFASDAEVAAATVGRPLQTYTLTLQDAAAFDGKTDGTALVKPVPAWSYLVVTPQKGRVILQMEQTDSRFKAVGLGFSGLARKLDELAKNLPATTELGLAGMQPGVPSLAVLDDGRGLKAVVLGDGTLVVESVKDALMKIQPAASAALENAKRMSEHPENGPGGGSGGGGGPH